MVGIEWSDGKQMWARTWSDLLLDVREHQWSSLDEQGFRSELAKRAIRWSRTAIDQWLPAGKLFKELERARMLIVVSTKEERN